MSDWGWVIVLVAIFAGLAATEIAESCSKGAIVEKCSRACFPAPVKRATERIEKGWEVPECECFEAPHGQ